MSVIHTEEARHEIHPASRSLHRERQAAKKKSGNGIGSLARCMSMRWRSRRRRSHVTGNLPRTWPTAATTRSRICSAGSRSWRPTMLFSLAEVAAGKVSPKLAPGEYAWLYSGPLLPEARDFIFRMMTPRQALEIAVRAERRAKAFFEQVLATSNDAGVRELAIELGRDEDSHIAWLQDALARVPEPFRPSEDCAGDPATPQALVDPRADSAFHRIAQAGWKCARSPAGISDYEWPIPSTRTMAVRSSSARAGDSSGAHAKVDTSGMGQFEVRLTRSGAGFAA